MKWPFFHGGMDIDIFRKFMYNYFDTIIPLEHPRYIMQYNSNKKDMFVEKYLSSLCIN